MKAGKNCFACPCLNVRLVAFDGNDDDGKGGVQEPKGVLDQDRVFDVGTEVQITISQPLLTFQQRGQDAKTTLSCLNCNMPVYAVDKALQPQQGQSRTTVGFDHSFSTGASASPLPTKNVKVSGSDSPSTRGRKPASDSTEDRQVLRPDPVLGMLWILSGCLEGGSALEAVLSSDAYSSTYGLCVDQARGEADMGEEEEAGMGRSTMAEASHQSFDSAVRRGKSPVPKPLHSQRKDDSSTSPSPARNKARAWVHRTEEEEGEDVDTLHLLETLLPPMPSSLYQDGSLRMSGGHSASLLSPRRGSSSLANTSYFPLQAPSTSQKRLEMQLEASGMTELRAHRESAQREVYALLKAKRKELGRLEQRVRSDARRLAGKRSRSSSKEEASRLAVAETERQIETTDGESQIAEELNRSNDSSSAFFERKRPVMGALSGEIGRLGVPVDGTSLPGAQAMASASLPGRVGLPAAPALQSGSYLSASFAMRGRDLPLAPVSQTKEKDEFESREDEEEWYAQKKRLRERYPHADHSALPSAVNSDDEGNVEVKKDQPSDEEDEERGRRGRQRGKGRESGGETGERAGQAKAGRDRQDKGSIHHSDDNGERREQMQSDEMMSKSLGVKKGALKGITSAKGGTGVASTIANEKRVAFAEIPGKKGTESRQTSAEGQKVALDEGADAVFEIDEDIEGDETPNSSDISLDNRLVALERGRRAKLQAEALEEALLAADEQEDGGKEGDNIAKSLPIVGSFSAMATSEQQKAGTRGEEGDSFDPASLRLTGETVYLSQPSELTTSTALLANSAGHSIGGIQDTSVYGSRPLSTRRLSLDRSDTLLGGFPESLPRRSSTIGFKVAVGEAEARLTGLLAPHAPSHRNLWSANLKRRINRGEEAKYELTEEEGSEEGEVEGGQGEQAKWAAWQRRSTPESSASIDGKEDVFARSVPIALAGRSSSHGRPINPASTTTTVHDKTSGFDLEPKTSLPYQERKLTPSLRKATRHLAPPALHRSRLPTISDDSDSVGSALDSVPPTSHATTAAQMSSISEAKPKHKSVEQFNYSVPVSTTRGFSTLPPDTNSLPTSTQSTPLMGSKGSELWQGQRRASRRQTPYVPPPPPSTYELRLQPNDKNRPASIELEEVEADEGFASREADEGEEEDLEKDLQFMHTLEQLKTNKRTGWLHHRVNQPESIADHMYRMGVLSMLLPNKGLDIGKCVQLCLVHDIAEALVGDLTPLDGVDKEEKLRREREALLYLVHDLLGSSPAALRIEALWLEYEERETVESKAVKDLDRFELCLQAVEYERRFVITDLQPFYKGSLGFISHPRVRRWARELAKEREQLWGQTTYKYHQTMPGEG